MKIIKKSWHKNNAITEWYLFSWNTISNNIDWNENTCIIKNSLLLIKFNFYICYHITYNTDKKELSLNMIKEIWNNEKNNLFKKWNLDKINETRYIIVPFYISSQNHWYIGVFLLTDNQDNYLSIDINKKIKKLNNKSKNVITYNLLIKMNNEISSNFNFLYNLDNFKYYQNQYLKLPTTEKNTNDIENYIKICIGDIFKNIRNIIPELKIIIP